MELFEGPHLDAVTREAMRADLADGTAEELTAQFSSTIQVLEGLVIAAEGMDAMTHVILNDAHRRAKEAFRRVGEAAGVDVQDL